MRFVGILLTLYEAIDTRKFSNEMPDFLGHYEGSHLIATFGRRRLWLVDDRLRKAAHTWLCQTLVADTEMNGSFFANGNLYADLALQYARYIRLRTSHSS